jgi:hypothetical protein
VVMPSLLRQRVATPVAVGLQRTAAVP